MRIFSGYGLEIAIMGGRLIIRDGALGVGVDALAFILPDSECLFTWELVRILGLLGMITFLWPRTYLVLCSRYGIV